MIQPTPHLSLSWLELLCDLFLPVVQSQAVEEHDTWQHAFSDIDTVIVAKGIDGDSRILPGVISAARMPLYIQLYFAVLYDTENKYNKHKLNKRNRKYNETSETNQHNISHSVCFSVSVNKAISPISIQIFYRIHAKVYTYFTVYFFRHSAEYFIRYLIYCKLYWVSISWVRRTNSSTIQENR